MANHPNDQDLYADLKCQHTRARSQCCDARNQDAVKSSLVCDSVFIRQPHGHIIHVAEEDLAAIERYYREEIPKDKDYRRRDLLTLLNNWNGEVDRARARLPKIRAAMKQQPIEMPIVDPVKEADFQKRLKEWQANGRPLGQFPT